MSSEYQTSHGHYLEKSIRSGILDFSGSYMAVRALSDLIHHDPAAITEKTIDTLRQLLLNPSFSAQTQARFLYREAAQALLFPLIHWQDSSLCQEIMVAFTSVFRSTNVTAMRAAAEVLCRLPLSLPEPEVTFVDEPQSATIQKVPWSVLLDVAGFDTRDRRAFYGRSLVVEKRESEPILVIKFATRHSSPALLRKEAAWMEFLGNKYGMRFPVPHPLRIADKLLFSLDAAPIRFPSVVDRAAPAFAFQVQRGYFHYLNDFRPTMRLDDASFAEGLFHNARLLGLLAAAGCIHTAPIPLFHNRVQQQRRNDGGLYDWTRAGRLDAWLDSTRFPNLSVAGVRDFEHFQSPACLDIPIYRALGNQILSLLLIIGSHFRFKRPKEIGTDPSGKPTDARRLFDEALLAQLIEGVFSHYHEGFVGLKPHCAPLFDSRLLARRMIEEMGIDRHMEEVLRVPDQNEMSVDEFRRFLVHRGFSGERARNQVKGEADIVILTGPHLGGFNQPISLPELIDFVSVTTAVCIFKRFQRDRFGTEFSRGERRNVA